MDQLHIEKNTVQETLVIPLFARVICNERFPDLFQDPKAAELIGRLDYDFGPLRRKSAGMGYQFGALEAAMRQTDLMSEMKDYLSSHPDAVLVNLGCGLDLSAENAAGETNRVVNIDLPDVIAVREKLLPGNSRVRNIGCDLNGLSWFDEINAENGVCFMAAGVFYYFRKEEALRLFNAMAERFPDGRLVFDAAGRTAVRIMLKTWVKEAGITSLSDYFCADDLFNESDPVPGALVSSKGYMHGYSDLKSPSVPALFRLLAKAGDGIMKMQIVRMDFRKDEKPGTAVSAAGKE